MQVLYPDQAELDRELASLLEEEKAAVLKLRASFDDRRRLATERFRERMADARKREIELRANLEEERAARKAAQSAEDERIKAIEIERIAVEYEAQRAVRACSARCTYDPSHTRSWRAPSHCVPAAR